MRTDRRPAARRPLMARRVVPRPAEAAGPGSSARPLAAGRAISPRRLGLIGAGALLAVVAAVGVLAPSPVAGGTHPDAAQPTAAGAAATAASAVGSAWGGAGGLDVLDLITKGSLVLILLFITLRVLGRMQAAGPKKGGRLDVLESRPLASKASLHLVAIGDRRLVVGLTPNGMVALTELDAGELEGAEEAAARDGAAAWDQAAGAGTRPAARPEARSATFAAALPFGATLNSLLRPIDDVTDRLAGFLNGGRTR